MPIEDYTSIEFGVALDNGNDPDIIVKLNTNHLVQGALYEMKENFYNQFIAIEGNPEQFQLAEKYGTSEKLITPLVENDLPELFILYRDIANILPNDLNIQNHLSEISYYFAVFNHNNHSRSIGIKRPTQFKGLLNKGNRIIQLVDDSFRLAPDNLFKLDIDFDFFLNQNTIDILHPTGFIYISNIDLQVLASAEAATNALTDRINFINFNHIAPLVGQNKTAAKLIASIKSRHDLENTQQDKLLDKCAQAGVLIENIGGLFAPQDGYLISFLQILDRRIYDYDLTDVQVEQYIAAARSSR